MEGALPRVAVLGATGAVGRALVQALDDGELPAAEVRLLASERGAGTEVELGGEALRVAAVGEGSFAGVDVALLAAGAAASRSWAPRALAAGAAVVDLSGAHRLAPDVPLVVREVNGAELDALARPGARRLAASPGPGVAALALALAPLRDAGLEEVLVTSLEPAAAAGQRAVEELEGELRALLAFAEPPPPSAHPHRLAFNLLPFVGAPAGDGASDEEARLEAELRRVLGAGAPRVRATAVRVPLFHGHAQLVRVRTARPLGAAEARERLRRAPGVKLLDRPEEGVFPMPMLAVLEDAVLVGRVRGDPGDERALELAVVCDDVRRAATGALAIARALLARAPAAR